MWQDSEVLPHDKGCKMQWISIKDKEPEIGQLCVWYDPESIRPGPLVGHYEECDTKGHQKCFQAYGGCMYYGVEQYFPVPELITEKK